MQDIRAIAALACFVLLTVALLPAQALLSTAGSRSGPRLARLYWRGVARIMRLGIIVEGRLPGRGPALLVANHASWLDVIALGAAVETAFIAKSEVAGWPLIGPAARAGRTIFIDRSRRGDTPRAVAAMRARFAGGDRLVLFAEGTSSDGRRVLKFRTSLMAAASSAHASLQIIPVSIAVLSLGGLPLCRRTMPRVAWYGDMPFVTHLWEVLRRGPVEMRIRFHDPIATDEECDRKQLTRRCESVVRAGWQEAVAKARYEAPYCLQSLPHLMAVARNLRGVA
ncbi:MAG: lysophospholipid acyltransferase family protein [Aestuariivirgaceae bacterium]